MIGERRKQFTTHSIKTKAFHNFILGKAKEIRFVEGRLKFEIARQQCKEAAPFPSMVVIYDGTPGGSGTTKVKRY